MITIIILCSWLTLINVYAFLCIDLFHVHRLHIHDFQSLRRLHHHQIAHNYAVQSYTVDRRDTKKVRKRKKNVKNNTS